MDKDIEVAEFGADQVDHSLDAEIAMLVVAAVIAGLFIHVVHGVVTDVAGDDQLRLEIAAGEGQGTGLDVVRLVGFQKIVDDVDHARMRGEHQARSGSLQRLGDVPGKAHVIADAGDEGNFALQVEGNHESLSGAIKTFVGLAN